jgi:hypothetical protein
VDLFLVEQHSNWLNMIHSSKITYNSIIKIWDSAILKLFDIHALSLNFFVSIGLMSLMKSSRVDKLFWFEEFFN